jgi:hypothetical protein
LLITKPSEGLGGIQTSPVGQAGAEGGAADDSMGAGAGDGAAASAGADSDSDADADPDPDADADRDAVGGCACWARGVSAQATQVARAASQSARIDGGIR